MNLNLISLKGVTRALQSIDRNLARIADCLEADAIDKGLKAVEPPTPNEMATIDYEDEEVTWGRENIPHFDELYEKTKE